MKLDMNRQGLELLTRFEGFRPKPYKDAVGVLTIGYGHTRSAVMPSSVTEEEAIMLLRTDLQYFERIVMEEVKVIINENQFSALVSFTYNLGEGNLRRSTLLKKLNAGDYNGAASEFAQWTGAGGKELKGLVKRRAAEEQLFRTPPPIVVSTRELTTQQAWAAMTVFEGDKPVGMNPQMQQGMCLLILPSAKVFDPTEVPSDDELQPDEIASGGQSGDPAAPGTPPIGIG